MHTVTAAREDALKTIYSLHATGGAVTNRDLARALAVAPPSASAMLGRLTDEGLVQRAGRRIELTASGEQAALRVIRRHRLLETFLVEELGLSWDEVHDEAERLEHALSDRLTDILDAKLGHPSVDPHGDPIPGTDRVHHEGWGASLADAPTGADVRVERVNDREPAALRHLAAIGVVPGTVVHLEDRGPFGEPIWIRVGTERHALGAELADLVHGRPVLTAEPAAS